MSSHPPKYRSYLLRLWQEGTNPKTACRFLLIQLQTGEQWGFVGLESLLHFLETTLLEDAPAHDAQDRKEEL
ncbi:MAG: hypothetical protein GXP40_08840 [Chloroflexi bacterium]|nr:hypothetical protein [Chloroflexota bacterium]